MAISATVTLGTTAATSDLTNLRDAINGYSSTTGIRATLNANKNAIVLAWWGRRCGYWKSRFCKCWDSVNTRMLVTMNSDQDVSGN